MASGSQSTSLEVRYPATETARAPRDVGPRTALEGRCLRAVDDCAAQAERRIGYLAEIGRGIPLPIPEGSMPGGLASVDVQNLAGDERRLLEVDDSLHDVADLGHPTERVLGS